MLFSKLFAVSSLFLFAAATDGPAGCHADNCARDVTGTRFGTARETMAFTDCESLAGQTNTALQTIPTYISNCDNFQEYSSACSCWGAIPTAPPCGGANVLTDPNNCGTCGNVCPYGDSCVGGVCTAPCGGADLLTDPNNCGTCGNVCDAGSSCVNGLCTAPACTGAVCGSFSNCDGSDNCYCFSTSDGTGFCADDQFCDGLADCNTTDDCGAGNVCIVNSCCVRNVCLPATCGNPAKMLVRAASRVRRTSKREPEAGCASGNC